MARRRPHLGSEESLELLLDTICNMFGGIIFIAILVAILTSVKAQNISTDPQSVASATMSAEQFLATKRRIYQYVTAINELRRSESLLSADGKSGVLDQLEALERARSDADRQREVIDSWLATFDRVVAQQQDNLQDQEQSLESLAAKLQKQLKMVQQENTIELRLPMSRTTLKMQVIIALRHGKMYVIPLGRAAYLLEDEFPNDVSIDHKLIFDTVTFNANGGVKIEHGFERSPNFVRLLRLIQSHSHYFDCYVYADSIGAFGYFKDVALRHGFAYNVTPIAAGAALKFVSSGKPGTVQ